LVILLGLPCTTSVPTVGIVASGPIVDEFITVIDIQAGSSTIEKQYN
jgi:hypothetical protein